jgi:hypothetical protein
MNSTASLTTNIVELGLGGGEMRFEDGAVLGSADMQLLPGTATLSFQLSSSGFGTLVAGHLGGSGWGGKTLVVDASNYNTANGTSLVLMDFASHNAAYDGVFNPSIQVSGIPGRITFDRVESQLVLMLYPEAIVWDNGVSNGAFENPGNWIGAVAPVSGSDSIAFDASISTADCYLKSEFVLASNKILLGNSSQIMRLADGGHLSIAEGAVVDTITLAQGSGTRRLTIDAGASVKFRNLFFDGFDVNFMANTQEVSTAECNAMYSINTANLHVDMTDYDTANGNALVLFDYSFAPGSPFSSITVTNGGDVITVTTNTANDYYIDYAYDIDGNGDLGIALIVPVALTSNGTPYPWLVSYNLVVGGDYEAADVGDNDEDGFLNWEEYRLGTDPTNALSLLAINNIAKGGAADEYVIAWQGVDGKSYNILTATDLVLADWTLNTAAVAGVAPETVSTATVSGAEAFIKIELAE